MVSLFGLGPRADADGVALTDLEGSQVDPVDLRQAVQDAIDMYGWPDIQTNVALSLRTIFATIPYYIDTFTTDITAQLQAIAGQGIFLVSDIAAIAVFPVNLIGDALYAVTNAIAQVVARLTGINGACCCRRAHRGTVSPTRGWSSSQGGGWPSRRRCRSTTAIRVPRRGHATGRGSCASPPRRRPGTAHPGPRRQRRCREH